MTMPKLKEKKVWEEGLDFRPKCPIVRNQSQNAQNECGGNRCAWWDTAYDMCIERSKARLLDGILADLNRIMEAIERLADRPS